MNLICSISSEIKIEIIATSPRDLNELNPNHIRVLLNHGSLNTM